MAVDFGDKEFKGVGFPTPFDLPEDTTCRTLEIPASGAWQAVVMGALLSLAYPENWQQFEGAITREEAAERALDMVWDAYDNLQCGGTTIAPYWDDEDGDDATGEPELEDFPWYENLADFAVTAFLAISFTPAAAVRFVTIARKIRLAFRTRDYGAILKIFIDGDEVGEIDTYSPAPGLAYFDYEIPEAMMLFDDPPSWLLRIEHTGTHNASATPTSDGYGMEVIRKNIRWSEEIVTVLRQNPEDSCQLEQSIDGGENWTLAFDYALCASPAGIPDTIIVNPGAPTSTFTHVDGETEAETQARNDGLCYASRKTVQLLMAAAADVCDNQVDGINLGQVVVIIAGAVLGAAGIIAVTGGYALLFVVLAALLQIAAIVQENSCELYSDEDIEDELTCIMYQNLQNRAVTLENFRHAFDYTASCATGDTGAVADVFQAMLSSLSYGQRMFDGFLNMLGEAQSAALQGVTIPGCVCAASTWCFEWDLTEGLGIWSIENGTFIPGTGVRMTSALSAGTYKYDCALAPAQTRAIVLRASVFFPAGTDLGLSTDSDVGIVLGATGGTSPTRFNLILDNANCQRKDGTNIYSFAYAQIGGQVDFEIHIDNNSGGATLDDLYSIRMQGQGNDPFGCDNC